jgi:uncharacterized membrane protein YkoI
MFSHPLKALGVTLLLTGIPLLSTVSISNEVMANPRVAIEQAALIARSTYPEGIIKGMELEDGRWEIEFTDDSEIEINATTGQVIKVEYKRQPPDPRLTPNISLEQVVDLARSRVPDSQIMEIELDLDDGRLIWEVEFSDDTEVKIDAQTGSVLNVERD